MNVKSPIVEIEIGGEVKKTSVLKNIKKNPNFEDNRILHFDVVRYDTSNLICSMSSSGETGKLLFENCYVSTNAPPRQVCSNKRRLKFSFL